MRRRLRGSWRRCGITCAGDRGRAGIFCARFGRSRDRGASLELLRSPAGISKAGTSQRPAVPVNFPKWIQHGSNTVAFPRLTPSRRDTGTPERTSCGILVDGIEILLLKPPAIDMDVAFLPCDSETIDNNRLPVRLTK